MAKIPFDIKYRPQIESGEYKVETKTGVSVRIICWDANGSNDRKDIIGLVGSTLGSENIQRYDITGHLIADSVRIGNKDLFIVTPEEELSDWEKAVGIALTDYQLLPRDKDGIANIHDIEEFTKKKAAELLSLAREQIIKDGYVIEKKAFHDAVEKVDPEVMKEVSENIDLENFIHNLSERYPEVSFAKLTRIAKAAYDYGKNEALKDLPRWIPNKFDKHNFETCKAYLDRPRYLCYQNKMIDVSELVEKLPGFKENENDE